MLQLGQAFQGSKVGSGACKKCAVQLVVQLAVACGRAPFFCLVGGSVGAQVLRGEGL